jgi:hypothetical protein
LNVGIKPRRKEERKKKADTVVVFIDEEGQGTKGDVRVVSFFSLFSLWPMGKGLRDGRVGDRGRAGVNKRLFKEYGGWWLLNTLLNVFKQNPIFACCTLYCTALMPES